MITRRSLFTTVGLGAVAVSLDGCASFSTFAQNAYDRLHVVAKKIEEAVRLARTSMGAAVNSLLPYFVPVCQIVISLNDVLRNVIASGVLSAYNANIQQALTITNKLATNSFIVQAAASGVIPVDPTLVMIGIIQGVALIMSLTGKNVSPTIAVDSGAVAAV